MKCGKDPFWICQNGLACCRGIYETGAKQGEKCGNWVKCALPLSCIGEPDKRRCFMKKGMGMKCGIDPYWVCSNGMICEDGRGLAVMRYEINCF